MATTLLPKAQIGVKKKTISTSVLRELKPEKGIGIEKGTKKESYLVKLERIRDFFLTKYNNDKLTFRQNLKRRQEEKRRVREEAIEKKKKAKKESKSSLLPKLKTPATLKSIFSSIGNFLLFLAGGILFNKFNALEPLLMGISKSLEVIGAGVQIFANVVGAITDFIDSSYKGYDKIKKQISNITGLSEEQVADFAGKLNKVINGTIIAALAVLRGLPRLMRMRKPPITSTPTTNIPRSGQFMGGRRTGIDLVKGTRTIGGKVVSAQSASRYTQSVTRFISGKANAGDMLRLLRRGFFKPFAKFSLKGLKVLPFGIGAFIDFIIQYFVFKEPAGRAAFKAIGAGLFGFLGTLIGGPFALFTGIGGAMLGDVAGSLLYDAIFSRSTVPSAIDEYTSYDQVTDTYTTVIQPIRS
mgnify:CR=1 FL=1